MKGLILCICAATPTTLMAYDYNGRFNLGLYQVKEEFKEPSAGTYTNDRSTALGSAYLDVTKIGPFQNQFTLDFRDRYEQYGTLEENSVRFAPSNEPQLRQLAIKYPYMKDRLYWAVGRFPVANAAVLGNDGAELGFKITDKIKVGAFGGLHPEHKDGKTLALDKEDVQGGAYLTFEERGRQWTRNIYATTAMVLRQPTVAEEPEAEQAPEGEESEENGEALSPEPADPEQEMFWYTNVVYQPRATRRITYISHVDLAPTTVFRNVWASWQETIARRVVAYASLLHVDLKEYERQRDIRDRLPGSTYTAGRLNGRYIMRGGMMIEAQASHGTRDVDDRSRSEFLGKFTVTRLAGGAMSLFFQGGLRQNFTSDDTIIRAGTSFFHKSFELSLAQQYIQEEHEDGRALNPLITDVNFAAMLGRQLMLAASLQYATDEEVTLTSALLTLGYRFSNVQYTPVRDRAPSLKRL